MARRAPKPTNGGYPGDRPKPTNGGYPGDLFFGKMFVDVVLEITLSTPIASRPHTLVLYLALQYIAAHSADSRPNGSASLVRPRKLSGRTTSYKGQPHTCYEQFAYVKTPSTDCRSSSISRTVIVAIVGSACHRYTPTQWHPTQYVWGCHCVGVYGQKQPKPTNGGYPGDRPMLFFGKMFVR